MRQVFQELASGTTAVGEVPAPGVPRGGLLIGTRYSLISAGTERMLVDFSRAGWLERARQQPDKVRQVLQKARTDGVLSTVEAVRGKLEEPLPLGYCNVGRVLEVGAEVNGFARGERVVSNGPHAEIIAVPRNLCAHVPAEVADEAAAFTVLGAIALQGTRLAQPTLGECVAVMGLGLIGLITVQLLRANGCRVLGLDPDPAKAALAREFGADAVQLSSGTDPLAAAAAFSRGRGVDAVLITAATSSSEPISQAAHMCRKRGRLVLVGVAGLELRRADFYEKELSFQVSCSYGPGRYDPVYEQGGHDYPLGFVRWTEQRNFEAVLDMMAAGRLDVRPLITHRFAVGEAASAYELLAQQREPYLGILLDYGAPAAVASARSIALQPAALAPAARTPRAAPRLGFIGAGNYGGRILMPAFAASGATLLAVASRGGLSAAHYGRKFRFARATTEARELLSATDIDALVVCTRHDTHAAFVCQALDAGKPIFVEKPLALTHVELDDIENAWQAAAARGTPPPVMVGFNRRFAPQVRRMRELLATATGPRNFLATVNAGALPPQHWTLNPLVGGGRIIGEGCHFIDLLRFLAGAPISSQQIVVTRGAEDCSAVISLGFADGSVGVIHYLVNGNRGVSKERLEVYTGGRVLQLDNFRQLRGFGWPGFSGQRLWHQDKGQSECARAFVSALRQGQPSPIPMSELLEVARVTVTLGEQARC